MTRNAAVSITNFNLAPIPLFILMGEILFHTKVANRAIDAIERVVTRLPGRMSLVTIFGGTVFSALSGSTIANTAMLGSTLLPEMLRRGYHPTMAMGPIMASGAIAMLIPPSALAVLLGSLAGISIAGLLVAGVIPALILAGLFCLYIVVRCLANPALAPPYALPDLTLGAVAPVRHLCGAAVGALRRGHRLAAERPGNADRIGRARLCRGPGGARPPTGR
jgi:TRAP-type C4-dicarboxylate transport system permease large subunit